MALSALKIGHGDHYGLYDSVTKSFILTGGESEIFHWKNVIEIYEQETANAEHLNNLKEEYLSLLVKGGNTTEQATDFLKKTIPNLWT